MATRRRGRRDPVALRAGLAAVLFTCSVAGAVWFAAAESGSPLSLEPDPDRASVAATPRPNAVPVVEREDTGLVRSLIQPSSVPAPGPVVDGPDRVAAVRRWVQDLHDDDVPRNATTAWRELLDSEQPVEPLLRPALRSRDRQQRRYATQILVLRGAPAWPELAEAAIELLRSDSEPTPWRTDVRAEVLRWLEPRVRSAAFALRPALYSDDALQRFMAAFALARGGVRVDRDVVCRLLIERLADNRIGGDATMAVHGLYRMGPDVLGRVREAMRFGDDQSLSLLRLLELDLTDPPRDRAAIERRRVMQNVTCLYHDPAVEYRIGRPRVPRR